MSKAPYVDFKAVKTSVSMLQILDHYGLTESFKRNNDSLSGACPLHNGENPTQFRVSISKNCWNCFGQCKRGGNVLDFVALKENVNVRAAALRIAEWFSLTFDVPPKQSESNGDAQEKPPQPVSRKPELNASPLREHTDSGPNKPLGFELQNLDVAHPYLIERGLTSETIAEFGLGFCAKGTMDGRVVIPIHNVDGKLLAYAGRWPGQPPEGTPKYKLPAGFKKSLELFNLHRAIQQPTEQSLAIVEGFFDAIKLWQHGCKRVVALMGSTLSPAQEELIRRHTNAQSRVFILLDEDDAGRAARNEIVQRLARFVSVRAHAFDAENKQPENLTADEVSALLGGAQ